MSTKMPTEDGLVPASEDRLRVQVHGIHSASGMDEELQVRLLQDWHKKDAQSAIATLSHEDILVTNAKDRGRGREAGIRRSSPRASFSYP